MASGPRYHVPLRRRREGKTDYKLRLGLLKSRKPRLVVRKTNNNIHVQLLEFNSSGDRVIKEATALELKKLGWKGHTGNAKSAYLTGYLLGKKAEGSAVVDFGLQNPKSLRLRCAVRGAKDAGLEINVNDELPNEEALKSKEIEEIISSMEV